MGVCGVDVAKEDELNFGFSVVVSVEHVPMENLTTAFALVNLTNMAP